MTEAQVKAAAMEAEFGVPGVVGFGVRGELVVVEVHTAAADAVVAVQGAHVAEWRSKGTADQGDGSVAGDGSAGVVADAVEGDGAEDGRGAAAGLWLSERTEWAVGKAIRGGVPVIWPWFGPRTEVVNGAPEGAAASGAHGLARTAEWQLLFAGVAGDAVHLGWGLGATEASRAAGFDGFRLMYEMEIGRELRLRLTVANDGPGELRFEEALHTYLAVSDVERVEIAGLEGTAYLDKRDGGARKQEGDGPVRLTGWTDRVYVETEAACQVRDGEREVEVVKDHSRSTVVWNPWSEGAAGLKDMAPEGWRGMVCVETANVGEAAVRLEAGQAHAMGVRLSVRG